MKTEFWILDHDAPGEIAGSVSASGPFPSAAAAERRIREDVAEAYGVADQADRTLGPGEHWAGLFTIVRAVRTVRPVPREHITVTLRKA